MLYSFLRYGTTQHVPLRIRARDEWRNRTPRFLPDRRYDIPLVEIEPTIVVKRQILCSSWRN